MQIYVGAGAAAAGAREEALRQVLYWSLYPEFAYFLVAFVVAAALLRQGGPRLPLAATLAVGAATQFAVSAHVFQLLSSERAGAALWLLLAPLFVFGCWVWLLAALSRRDAREVFGPLPALWAAAALAFYFLPLLVEFGRLFLLAGGRLGGLEALGVFVLAASKSAGPAIGPLFFAAVYLAYQDWRGAPAPWRGGLVHLAFVIVAVALAAVGDAFRLPPYAAPIATLLGWVWFLGLAVYVLVFRPSRASAR